MNNADDLILRGICPFSNLPIYYCATWQDKIEHIHAYSIPSINPKVTIKLYFDVYNCEDIIRTLRFYSKNFIDNLQKYEEGTVLRITGDNFRLYCTPIPKN